MARGIRDERGIAVQVTDGDVDLGDCDAEAHTSSIAGFQLPNTPYDCEAVAHTDLSELLKLLPSLDSGTAAATNEALARSADPAYALAELVSLAEAAPEQTAVALANDGARSGLVTLATGSRSLTKWLCAHPDEIVELCDPFILSPAPDAHSLREEALHAVHSAASPADALRLWKNRRFLCVALRDLSGLTTFSEVGAGLADLADAALQAALVIASDGEPDRLAIIGMGKLGGRELNYSSDVDVMLIAPGGDENKLARRFLEVMSEFTSEGIVWRVDCDLRPEGRSGPLTRSLEAFLAYYERWADAWEFQALIKRRAVAGNDALGLEFMTETERFVYPPSFPPERLEEIRALKARAEAQVAEAGLSDREVKLGRGGIRDVEFSVQLLQLVHGRDDPTIRSPTTLTALHQLAAAGYIGDNEADVLANSYIKLRTVEHALQLEDEAQIHALPVDSDKLDHLARMLGYRPDPGGSAAEKFRDEFRKDLVNVRSVHERLFYRPLLEAFATASPDAHLSEEAAQERLRVFGFSDVAATRRALKNLTSGLSRRSNLMAAILPLMLGWLSDTPDPNLGLLMLERLTEKPHHADTITTVFRDSPLAAQRFCTLIGTSRYVGEGFEHFPELMPLLADDKTLHEPADSAEIRELAARQLAWRDDHQARLRAIRRFVQRERLRIAIRDLLGLCDAAEVAAELAAVAESSVAGALRTASETVEHPPGIAIIGMGSFGGGMLNYNSDLDVIVVYDERPGRGDRETFAVVEKIVMNMIETLSSTTESGVAYTLDLDLRPEGKHGVLARSLAGYEQYWQRWAETWEFQSLTRTRFVAGDAVLGEEFVAAAERHVYEVPFAPSRADDIRAMKARVDRERLPRGADPQLHMKLGRGGSTDIEFCVQLLQMTFGGEDASLRRTSTLDAIAALEASGHLAGKDAGKLAAAYELIRVLRNRLVLLGARDANELPMNLDELARLARSVGYRHNPAPRLREEYRRMTRRAHEVADSILFPVPGTHPG